MKDDLTDRVVLYKTEDGRMTLDVNLREDTVWLNLNQLASLFDRDKSVVSRHLRKIFQTGELERKSVVAFFATTALDGKTYRVEYFNLDVIISVGYRVNSKRGTQFRIWATNVLRDHIIKGYSINEKRLKEENRRLKELQQAVDLLGRIVEEHQLAGPEAPSSAARRTVHSKALLAASTRPLKVKTSIRALKKKPRTFYISWSRTILSLTAINVSRPLFSSGSSMPTGSSTAPAALNASGTTHSLH